MKRIFLVSLFSLGTIYLTAQTSATATTSSQANEKKQVTVQSTIPELPGFPVYVSTGNPEADRDTYMAAKNKWINENTELYNKYLEAMSKTSVETKVEPNPSNPTQTMNGTEKEKWIKENPDKYNGSNNNQPK